MHVDWYLRRVAERELVRHQSFHPPLGVGEIFLPAARSLVRLRLREMQGAGCRPGVRAGAPHRLPLPLQRVPHRSPVLRRRFHHDFLNLLVDEPLRQRTQLIGAGPHHPALKLIVALDGDIGHRHRQHPLVHIDPRNPVRHTALLAGAANVP